MAKDKGVPEKVQEWCIEKREYRGSSQVLKLLEKNIETRPESFWQHVLAELTMDDLVVEEEDAVGVVN